MTVVGRMLYLRQPLAGGEARDYCFGRVVDHMGISTPHELGPWEAFLCHDDREGFDPTCSVVAARYRATARVTLFNTYLGDDQQCFTFARGEFLRAGANVDELIAEAAGERPRFWDRTRGFTPHLDGPDGYMRGLHGAWPS